MFNLVYWKNRVHFDAERPDCQLTSKMQLVTSHSATCRLALVTSHFQLVKSQLQLFTSRFQLVIVIYYYCYNYKQYLSNNKNNDISTAIPKITSITATDSSTIIGNSINTNIRVITVITTIFNILISLLLLLILSLLFILLS